MSNAFIAGVTIKRGDAAGPEVFTAIEEAISLSGLGKTNPLIDQTNFDSTAKEYIAGLPDGTEITLECNFLPGATVQQLLIGDVDSKTNRNLEITITDGTTPLVYTFAVVPLSWTINPQVEDRNTLTFTLKITGAITVA